MSFDSLTIFGILASMLSGGFVLSTVFRTDTVAQATFPMIGRPEGPAVVATDPQSETAIASGDPWRDF
jgi:hypothetical protein